ncbi:MAG: hypothetical protein ACRD1E_13635, partial [Terriglobales bacterium]
NLGFAPATAASLAWNIPDVATVGVGSGQDAATLLTSLHELTPHPLLLEAQGCATPSPSWRQMPDLPAWIGTVWSPSADWESGPCAAETSFWTTANRAAASAHGAAH